MLEKLEVNNISILDSAEINFSSGLNIATGETGAGKSLILSTLVFFLEKKFPNELIKNKEKETIISINIVIDNSKIKEILSNNKIEVTDNSLNIKRIINSSKVTKYYIDGIKVKAEVVSSIFQNYFSFFVQGAQSFLISKKYQLNILDRFANLDDLILDYRGTFNRYLESDKKLKKVLLQKKDIEERRDFLRFQLEELKEIKIASSDEELELIEEVKKQKVINENSGAITDLITYIDEIGVNSINEIENKINKSDFFPENIKKIIKDISVNMNELSYQVSMLKTENLDDEFFIEKQNELFLLKDLRRKYKLTTEDLINKKKEIIDLFSCESEIDNMIYNMEKENSELKEISLKKANIISKKRKASSGALTKLVKTGLSDLGILNSNWIISFREIDLSENGTDDIEFLFSANPDFPPEPLKSVASGGELSRIMLILALEISKIFESKIILFDEPDVGLGGAIAEKLGEKISQLSKSSQVLCISHLPQVASFADTHLLISKRIKDGSTIISVNRLTKEERIKEIARMISGKKIEQEALILADKMVK
tara:strand:- start:7837 stop:9468 length:1632 start_codon:yes stop_codon:yes gene_type:complete